jgi:hypothetical protein
MQLSTCNEAEIRAVSLELYGKHHPEVMFQVEMEGVTVLLAMVNCSVTRTEAAATEANNHKEYIV